MPKPYEDEYRNDIASTLAARQSPMGYGMEQAGRAFSPSPFGGAGVTAQGSVPMVGGAGGSVLPTPQGMMGAQGATMPTLGGMPGMEMMPGLGQRPRMPRRGF